MTGEEGNPRSVHMDSEASESILGHNDQNAVLAAPARGKKKNKRQTVASRGPCAMSKARGTGFEEYFADPPLTPIEAREEKDEIYPSSLSIEERVQNCISRFRNRRRLNSELALYFNEYLFLGGVDTNPKQFSGLDAHTIKEMDLSPVEMRELTATDAIYTSPIASGEKFYGGEREELLDGKSVATWTVDFTGVVSGFLSTAVVALTGLEEQRLRNCIGVVENFLKYVLQHDVCPEYAEDVTGAIKVCEAAREEWPMIRLVEAALPGQFNLAAAQLYGVHEDSDWAMLAGFESESETEAVFRKSLEDIERKYLDCPCDHSVVMQERHSAPRVYDCQLKLMRIDSLSCGMNDGLMPGTIFMNKVSFATAAIEDGHDRDLEETRDSREVVLFFEDDIVSHLKLGMKFSVTLVDLGFGLTVIKSLQEVVPTFHTFLPQELMKNWKSPRPVDKSPPSVHDGKDKGHDDAQENQD